MMGHDGLLRSRRRHRSVRRRIEEGVGHLRPLHKALHAAVLVAERAHPAFLRDPPFGLPRTSVITQPSHETEAGTLHRLRYFADMISVEGVMFFSLLGWRRNAAFVTPAGRRPAWSDVISALRFGTARSADRAMTLPDAANAAIRRFSFGRLADQCETQKGDLTRSVRQFQGVSWANRHCGRRFPCLRDPIRGVVKGRRYARFLGKNPTATGRTRTDDLRFTNRVTQRPRHVNQATNAVSGLQG